MKTLTDVDLSLSMKREDRRIMTNDFLFTEMTLTLFIDTQTSAVV